MGLKLAADCPKLEKAFTLSTKGKVLGIMFDTVKLAWSLPEDKCLEYVSMISDALSLNELSLFNAESLLGKLNFVTSMAPFMRTFKANLQILIATMLEAGLSSLPLPLELVSDLRTWAAFLTDSLSFIPIAAPRSAPPLRHKTITTDASGWKASAGKSLDAGLGVVVIDEEGELSWASQTFWGFPDGSDLADSSGKFLGCKTTSLELTGLLVAILQLGNDLQGQHVVMQVDNIGCHYVWPKGYSTSDRLASVLARLLCLLEAKLCMSLHVVHHPRMSSWESCLADRLSRARTTTASDQLLLRSFRPPPLQHDFMEWMQNPREDWDMPLRVVKNF